jgi:hypothetical protein
MKKIDYFVASLIMAVSIGICFGNWLGDVWAGFGFGLIIMFVGAMIDFITSNK